MFDLRNFRLYLHRLGVWRLDPDVRLADRARTNGVSPIQQRGMDRTCFAAVDREMEQILGPDASPERKLRLLRDATRVRAHLHHYQQLCAAPLSVRRHALTTFRVLDAAAHRAGVFDPEARGHPELLDLRRGLHLLKRLSGPSWPLIVAAALPLIFVAFVAVDSSFPRTTIPLMLAASGVSLVVAAGRTLACRWLGKALMPALRSQLEADGFMAGFDVRRS